jgi:hypothetical protein
MLGFPVQSLEEYLQLRSFLGIFFNPRRDMLFQQQLDDPSYQSPG